MALFLRKRDGFSHGRWTEPVWRRKKKPKSVRSDPRCGASSEQSGLLEKMVRLICKKIEKDMLPAAMKKMRCRVAVKPGEPVFFFACKMESTAKYSGMQAGLPGNLRHQDAFLEIVRRDTWPRTKPHIVYVETCGWIPGGEQNRE